MSDFTAIGQLVTEARNLLDSIKGGAIRTMQTQFDILKQTITTDGAKVVSDVEVSARSKLQEFDSELAAIRQGFDINALGGEARYVTEITVGGQGDKLYPVVFRMPSVGESEISIQRSHIQNGSGSSNPSDLNTSTPGGVLVVLRGSGTSGSGVPAFLRTIVNKQTYRRNVAAIAMSAFCRFEKGTHESGSDTYYNVPRSDFGCYSYSGFMLRGGTMTYRITANRPISFDLMSDGDLILDRSDSQSINAKMYAKVVGTDEVAMGDSHNDKSTNYISYDEVNA